MTEVNEMNLEEMQRPIKGINPRDILRKAILQHLYDIHRNARSLRGAGIGIRDLKKAMKGKGMTHQEVVSNLDYLIQQGWVVPDKEERIITTKAGVKIPSVSTRFKISKLGIDMLEGESQFQRNEKYAGINITNIQGVMVVGNENVVNTQYPELFISLGELQKAISQSSELSDKDKLNATADIETLRSQLSKPKPDQDIIRRAWSAIQTVETAVGLAELLAMVAKLIGPLLG